MPMAWTRESCAFHTVFQADQAAEVDGLVRQEMKAAEKVRGRVLQRPPASSHGLESTLTGVRSTNCRAAVRPRLTARLADSGRGGG
jgi:hypothetical protein